MIRSLLGAAFAFGIATSADAQTLNMMRSIDAPHYDAQRTKMLAGVPLRDVSSTDDVANLALYLASDEARTITGQSVVVDAGSYMLG